LTGTLTSNGSTSVTGSVTNFTAELRVGDSINLQGESATVASITSDTAFVATAVVAAATGSAYHTKEQFTRKWYMSAVGNKVVSPRIQYRVIANTSDSASTPTIQSVAFWYLPEPEPNWIIDLTVGIAERWQLLDGTDDTQDIEDQLEKIREYGRTQQIITFTDREGNTFDALVWDYVEDWHVPGKANEPKEAYLRVSILEVADE